MSAAPPINMEYTLHKAHELAKSLNRKVNGAPHGHDLSPHSIRDAYLHLEPADDDSLSYQAKKIGKELASVCDQVGCPSTSPPYRGYYGRSLDHQDGQLSSYHAKRLRAVMKVAREARHTASSAIDSINSLIKELGALNVSMPETEESPKPDPMDLLEELERKKGVDEEIENESDDNNEPSRTGYAESVLNGWTPNIRRRRSPRQHFMYAQSKEYRDPDRRLEPKESCRDTNNGTNRRDDQPKSEAQRDEDNMDVDDMEVDIMDDEPTNAWAEDEQGMPDVVDMASGPSLTLAYRPYKKQ